MLEIVKGDAVQALQGLQIEVLAHGVNCQGAFNSGIAKDIGQHFPEAKQEYLKKHNEGHIYGAYGWSLGDTQIVTCQKSGVEQLASFDRYIINCATQRYYGNDNKQYVDYEAIRYCMKQVKYFAKLENLKIGIPRIGAGLGGGDWKIIEDILLEVFDNYDITILVKDALH